MALGNVLTMS